LLISFGGGGGVRPDRENATSGPDQGRFCHPVVRGS
jgi:hypothetical protein